MTACTIYKNTGYTHINRPYDIESLLAAAESAKEMPALDLIQVFKLRSIRIKAFEADVKNVDYCILDNGTDTAAYVVYDYNMTSLDVAELYLDPDLGITAGGWDKININSGMWSRAYDLNGGEMVVDGMFQLSELPKYWYMHDWASQEIGDGAEDCTLFVATTIDLEEVPEAADKVAYTFDDETGEVSYAYVPTPISMPTEIEMRIHRDMVTNVGSENYSLKTFTDGYRIYNYGSENVRSAVQRLRGYGYESTIIGAWRVPNKFLNIVETLEDMFGGFDLIVTKNSVADVTSFPFMNPARLYHGFTETAQENADLIRHSDYYRIGLMSVPTGAKLEKRRDEITGATYGAIDPRKGGAPYFILQGAPKPTDGILTEPYAYIAGELQRNSIQGAAWDDIPIIYEGASGSSKDYMKLYMSENFANANYQNARSNLAIAGMAGMFGSMSGVKISLPGYIQDAPGEYGMNEFAYNTGSISGFGLGNAAKAGAALYSTLAADEALQQRRYQESKTAMAQYVINNKLVAPQVTTQTIEGLQQFFGNSAVIYAMYPTANDVDRWGEIAAMFGVACNRPADAYIRKPVTACFYQGSGIQATTAKSLPKAIREDIGNLLNIGVRLWSGKPRKLTAADWAERRKD